MRATGEPQIEAGKIGGKAQVDATRVQQGGDPALERQKPREGARVVARGKSKATGRPFNLSVAFEAVQGKGRAIAESSFHHFADYNWEPRKGCPRFVGERAGDEMLREPEARASVHAYARNLALWLAGVREFSRL